jgi:hypothetical protein
MKKLLVTMFVALLMVGVGEEVKDYPSVPLLIPCATCGEKVSKKAEKYLKCGHPTPVNVFKSKTLLAPAQEEKSGVLDRVA